MASQPIYQFYAELNDYTPKIWRHFQVPRNITVARLGYIILTMFEMQTSHLFCIEEPLKEKMSNYLCQKFSPEQIAAFFADNDYEDIRTYEVKNKEDDESDEDAFDAVETKMYQIFSKAGDYVTLLYDYGDGWEVKITLEKIFEDKELPGKELPRVLEGDGYGIIEDCGGVGGLLELAKVFGKKSGKRYKELSEWLDVTELDLNSFDIADMNFRLKKVPRIYADAYEYSLEPTKQSLNLLDRKYKK